MPIPLILGSHNNNCLISCTFWNYIKIVVKPSDILNDVSRVKHLMAVVDPHDLFDKVEFAIRPLTHEKASLIEKADVLFAMLRMRVPPHVRGRVKKSQQSHLV